VTHQTAARVLLAILCGLQGLGTMAVDMNCNVKYIEASWKLVRRECPSVANGRSHSTNRLPGVSNITPNISFQE
jgi:uncharacterized membrane protein